MKLIKRNNQSAWDQRLKETSLVVSYGRPHPNHGKRWYLEVISRETGYKQNVKFRVRPTKKQIRKSFRFLQSQVLFDDYWSSI